jgi:hypothetical protein
VRVDELEMFGTHNSYHVQSAIPVDASHKYTHKPLDQQLEGGVRQLEIDVHKSLGGVLEVYHLALIDQQTTCSTLAECLGVINGWSVAHPMHTPIFVWFEIKDDVGGVAIDSLVPVEDIARTVLGNDHIFSPANLKSTYASPHARLDAEGWPRLDEMRGKIMLILLNDDDTHASEYTHGYTNLDDRWMFASAASARTDAPWAVVTKIGPTDAAQATAARAKHLLLCTNVCSVDTADAECTTRLAAARANGIHMLSDDLPFAVAGRSYHLALPNGSPDCNPVSASASCGALPLE